MPPLARASPGTGRTQTSVRDFPLNKDGSNGASLNGRGSRGNAPNHAGGDNCLAVVSDTEGSANGDDVVTILLSTGVNNAVSQNGDDASVGPAQTVTHVTPTLPLSTPPQTTLH